MQISFDTTNARDVRCIRAMLDHLDNKAETPLPVIKPADIPSTGTETNTLALFAATVPALIPTPPAVAQALALPVVQTGVELDTEGLPWDERIHAGTKNKTQEGKWKARKGINDPGMIQRVKAELLATLALPPAAAAVPTIPGPVFQQPQAAAAPLTLPASLPLPSASPPSVAQPTASALTLPPVASAAPTEPKTLGELFLLAGPLMAAGKIAPDALQKTALEMLIPSLEALATANRPDLVTELWRRLPKG